MSHGYKIIVRDYESFLSFATEFSTGSSSLRSPGPSRGWNVFAAELRHGGCTTVHTRAHGAPPTGWRTVHRSVPGTTHVFVATSLRSVPLRTSKHQHLQTENSVDKTVCFWHFEENCLKNHKNDTCAWTRRSFFTKNWQL